MASAQAANTETQATMSENLITMHEGRDVLGKSIHFPPTAVHSIHVYEVRPRRDHRGVDLISDVLRSGVYGMTGRMRSRMQSSTRCTTADHMMP